MPIASSALPYALAVSMKLMPRLSDFVHQLHDSVDIDVTRASARPRAQGQGSDLLIRLAQDACREVGCPILGTGT